MVVVLCLAHLFDSHLIPMPDIVRDSTIIELLSSACAVLAVPFAIGGWFLIWGDNGPPYPFLDHAFVNILVGITLCTALCLCLSSLSGRVKRNRDAAT